MTELTNERADFEAYMRAEKPLFPLIFNDAIGEYKSPGTQHRWESWQAACRATPSSDCALPPLPEPSLLCGDEAVGDDVYGYTAEQVEQIRREAVEADRRARGHAALQALADQAQELDMGYGPPSSAVQGDDDVERRLRAQAVAPFGPKGFALLVDAAQYIAYLRAQLAATHEEIKVSDQLLEQRNRVLKAIPACDAHGDQCVPHALEWIAAQLARQSQEPQAYMIRDKREQARYLAGGADWKPCSIEDYELRKEHTDIFEFQPLFAAPAHPVAQPAQGDAA